MINIEMPRVAKGEPRNEKDIEAIREMTRKLNDIVHSSEDGSQKRELAKQSISDLQKEIAYLESDMQETLHSSPRETILGGLEQDVALKKQMIALAIQLGKATDDSEEKANIIKAIQNLEQEIQTRQSIRMMIDQLDAQ